MSMLTQESSLDGYDVSPRYDLSVEEIQDITGAFLDAEDADLPRGRFIGIMADAASPIANVGRTTERTVFEQTFEGNDVPFMHREYGDYEDSSRFLMVIDRRRRVAAGVLRIIVDSEVGLKSLNDAARQTGQTVEQIREHHGMLEGDKIWDIATLAAPTEYRGRPMQGVQSSLMLQRMFNTLVEQEGIQHAVAIIDEKALRAVKAIGLPLQTMVGAEEPFSYLDSAKSYAVYGSLPDFRASVEQRVEDLESTSGISNIFRLGVKRYIKRRMLAKAAGNLASGNGLDEHITLPS